MSNDEFEVNLVAIKDYKSSKQGLKVDRIYYDIASPFSKPNCSDHPVPAHGKQICPAQQELQYPPQDSWREVYSQEAI